ncbi:MAG: aminopeptidase P family protein [Acidobacteria bacterium]|nr:aminopeptidase P family protein [Acidobacteriota bacterium]MBI3424295.1 aminopeptidase P family protein [Acidobacteriota bacterium]
MLKPTRSVFIAFLLLTTVVPAQEGFSPFTTDFPPEEFAARRTEVYKAIGENGLALVQGAPSPAGYTRFRQSNEFYYLCGIEVPHAYLLLDGATRRASLYLPHRNEGRERGEGKMLSAEDAAEVVKLSGVETVYGSDLLNEHLARATRTSGRALFTPFSPAEGFAMSRDLAVRVIGDYAADPFDGRPSREGALIQTLRGRFPQFEIKDLTPALDRLRLIKSPRELALIKKATRLGGLALMEAMRSTEPGIYEHELDGMAKYVYYRNGAQGEAYYSLIASGRNAWYPHYNAGKRQMRDGDFLLMDFAPDVGYYMSDVTRMMPVNGVFNAWQRELYGFYLGCYQAVLKAINPNVTAQVVIQEAVKEMEQLLASSKFSKPAYENAAKAFVARYQASAKNPNASLGHWVGMATHDDGPHEGPLRAGMVFTIEPALTVPEEQIYIRLEDLIIITATGKEIVSDFVPMEIDAIEKLMKEEGMLQRYPKDGGLPKP